jgi:hypothetical protein
MILNDLKIVFTSATLQSAKGQDFACNLKSKDKGGPMGPGMEAL